MKVCLGKIEGLKGRIVPVCEGEKLGEKFADALMEKGLFEAKPKSLYAYVDGETLEQVVLVGLGESEKVDANKLMNAVAKGAKH